MLTLRECATIRAALLFWSEEMDELEHMRAYMEPKGMEPVSLMEIKELRKRLTLVCIRYAVYDPTTDRLFSTALFHEPGHVLQVAQYATFPATVFLPPK